MVRSHVLLVGAVLVLFSPTGGVLVAVLLTDVVIALCLLAWASAPPSRWEVASTASSLIQ